MLPLINQMAHLRYWAFGFTPSAIAEDRGVANGLLQSAGARAGQNPHEAAQLRQAARAYLSVVR